MFLQINDFSLYYFVLDPNSKYNTSGFAHSVLSGSNIGPYVTTRVRIGQFRELLANVPSSATSNYQR